MKSWTERDPKIADRGQKLAIRAGRWVTRQIGEAGRTVNEIDHIKWTALDISGPYKKVFDTVVPDAVQIVDRFHVIKHTNSKVDECRRRVQNQTFGHRGRKGDPLYRIRKALTRAAEKLDIAALNRLLKLTAIGETRRPKQRTI